MADLADIISAGLRTRVGAAARAKAGRLRQGRRSGVHNDSAVGRRGHCNGRAGCASHSCGMRRRRRTAHATCHSQAPRAVYARGCRRRQPRGCPFLHPGGEVSAIGPARHYVVRRHDQRKRHTHSHKGGVSVPCMLIQPEPRLWRKSARRDRRPSSPSRRLRSSRLPSGR